MKLALENQLLGQGWIRQFVQRKASKRVDVILASPAGKKFRNYAELSRFLVKYQPFELEENEELLRSIFRPTNANVKPNVLKNDTRIKPVKCRKVFLTPKKFRPIMPKSIEPQQSTEDQQQISTTDNSTEPSILPQQQSVIHNTSNILFKPSLPQRQHDIITTSPQQQFITTTSLQPTTSFPSKLSSELSIDYQEIEIATVSSPNIYVSDDQNMLIDNEVELSEVVTSDEFDLDHDDGQNDLLEQCVPNEKLPKQFENFLNNPDSDNEDNEKSDNNNNDHDYDDDECPVKRDHNYDKKLSLLEMFEVYFNFDKYITEETYQKMVDCSIRVHGLPTLISSVT